MSLRYSVAITRLALVCALLAGSASFALGADASTSNPAEIRAELQRLARIAAESPGPWRQVPGSDATRLGPAPSMLARTALPAALQGEQPGPDLWQPGFGLPSLNEYPSVAIEFHGDLVVAGWVHSAGGVRVNGIARWTATGWQPLGEGVGAPFALAVHDDRLIAGNWTGEVSAWDGQKWTALPKAPVNNLAALFECRDTLYVAGTRYNAGTPYQNTGIVARFDGSGWTRVGGYFNDSVLRLGVFEGQLVASGRFTTCDGFLRRYVTRWDGSRWAALGEGIDETPYASVQAIQEFGGRLYVGGYFRSCSGEPTDGLASFDGAAWHALPGDPHGVVYDLMDADGRLWVAGSLYGAAWAPSSVQSFDGTAWNASLEPLNAWALGLATWGGRVVAAGGFDGAGAGERALPNLAVLGPGGWEGFESWSDQQHGLANNAGAALAQSVVTYHGSLVVSGSIRLAGTPSGWKRLNGIGAWDGHEWSTLGDPAACISGALTVIGDDLILAGYFGVARWDGSSWHPVGDLHGGLAQAVCGYGGFLYVGGEGLMLPSGETTTLARWDGSRWSAARGAPSGALYNSARVNALLVDHGRLVVGGNFTFAGGIPCGGVAEWDGYGWSSLGSGPGGEVRALAVHRGELYAGGLLARPEVYEYEGVKRWTGQEWAGLGLLDTQVTTLASYGGRLAIGGLAGTDRFAPGSPGLVGYDDGQWTRFGEGLAGEPAALCQWGGDLIVVGHFDHAGAVPAYGIARWAGSATPPPGPDSRASLSIRAPMMTSNGTTVRYEVPGAGRVRVDVYDVMGARVATLLDRTVGAGGSHEFVWQAGSPAPLPKQGIYFLRLRYENQESVAKLVIAR